MKIATSELEHLREEVKNCHCIIKNLQKKREFVGLTDEDYQILREGVVKQGKPLHWMIEHIEAKLKEKNL